MVRLKAKGEFDLDRTMLATYFSLRWATVAMAVAFPPLMVIGGVAARMSFGALA
jgi:hypothetical protein